MHVGWYLHSYSLTTQKQSISKNKFGNTSATLNIKDTLADL